MNTNKVRVYVVWMDRIGAIGKRAFRGMAQAEGFYAELDPTSNRKRAMLRADSDESADRILASAWGGK